MFCVSGSEVKNVQSLMLNVASLFTSKSASTEAVDTEG